MGVRVCADMWSCDRLSCVLYGSGTLAAASSSSMAFKGVSLVACCERSIVTSVRDAAGRVCGIADDVEEVDEHARAHVMAVGARAQACC